MSVHDHAKLEKSIADYWKQENVYEKAKARKGKPFFFMDGPPYATGSIHLGTAWNKIIKDVYLRFFRMQGRQVWDQPGYDTHGTPIETKVEKNLGFSSKKDIESYGIGKFVKKCREYATKYIDVMNGQFADLGVWMDWERPYLTLDNQYIEGAWYTFRKAFESGFLYKGKYPVHVCPRCETVVAYNEIEYTKQTDTSIYVKLRLKKEPDKYLIIWTTTPWTLPGNTGVMVHPKFSYAEVEMTNGETWIIAMERVQGLMEAIEAGYTIKREFPGKELEGLEYEGPLHDKLKLPELKNAYRVILSDRYVHLEDGTGLVHTAPGHGKEDFEAGNKAGIPAICPVGVDGLLTKEAGKYAGKKARVVDEEIISDLEAEDMLVYKHPHTHDYPVCWRCSSPLLQVGVPQWFFKVTAIREKLLSENRKVKWIPEWAGTRFNDWLENLSDWPISRQRYWGIPLPIWECPCGNIDVVGSFSELKRKSGLKKEIDFHRPEIDTVQLKCRKCGKKMSRVPDVLDVWFDSGVATWASLGYPRKKEMFKKMWPSAFQTEGPDQFRGWWNSQIITSVLTFGKAPYKNVLLHGMVMDVKGIKLSKSKGNFIDPKEIIDKYGRDVMRFYLMSIPTWNDFYFSWDDIKEVKRLFNVFWNSYNFIKTYAPQPPTKAPELKPEDRWIISRLNTLIDGASAAKGFQAYKLVQSLSSFILEDFSRMYIKLIRDRVSPWNSGSDKKAAVYTLNHVLENLTKILAPFSPYVSDHIYLDLYGKESIHLQDFPSAEKKLIRKDMEKEMETVREMAEAASALRHEKGIKLRWPVEKLVIYAPKGRKAMEKLVSDFGDVLKNLCNVKEVQLSVKSVKGSDFSGGRLSLQNVLMDEAMLRELSRNVQISRKKAGLMVMDRIDIWIDTDRETTKKLKEREEDLLAGVGARNVTFGPVEGEGKGSIVFGQSRIKFEFGKAG